MISRELAGVGNNVPGLLGGVRSAFRLLSAAERWRMLLVFASMLLNATLGLVGLAAILPFAYLMIEPAPLAGDGMMPRALQCMGITSVDNAIVLIGSGAAAAIVLKNVYSLLHLQLINALTARAEIRLACAMLDSVLAAPYAWLTRQNAAVLHNIIVGRTVEWSRGVIRTTLTLLTEIIFLALAVLLLVVTSPRTGLAVSTAAVVIALALSALARPWIQQSAKEKARLSRLSIITSREAVVGGRDVRIGAGGPMLRRMFRQEFTGYAHWDTRGRLWQSVPRHGIEIVGFLALLGFAFAALSIGLSRFEVGTLLALYSVVAMRAVPAASQVVQSLAALRSAMPALAELLWLVGAAPAARGARQPDPHLHAHWRMIKMRGLGVRYAADASPALTDINTRFERGRSYGVVGSSGAGKSTLADVLAGLIAPSEGEVWIDDRALTEETAVDWRQHVSYVTQSPLLLDATLAENIVFGERDEDRERERLEAAVAQAGLAGLVAAIPGGLDARCGDGAIALSGGQRQRVAIARALYRNADLLLMDEATSALDSLTEREIQQSVRLLSGRMTIVIIAHRLSTVVECNEILVLDHGCLVAQGTHAELLETSPHYRRLVQAQILTVT